MHIVIAAGGMPFGPHTPSFKSLGGSETAALELAKALGARGHNTHLFCQLPHFPDPDACEPGFVEGGVVYHAISEYGDYVLNTEHDLTIGLRDPQFMVMKCKSKKKVLWAHDIFTSRGMKKALDNMSWTFDEIWCVSEWHRQQIHEATDYPLKNIVALRNGVVKYDDIAAPVHYADRDAFQLVYAARPERGLDNLIMPGGVMDNLPEYTLTVAMYEHFPEHMRDYYEQILRRMKAMPNVNFIGGKPNRDLRQIIGESAAYIYPTQFEETSCILARECIEQKTPFFTTKTGALPETLDRRGIFFETWLEAKGRTEKMKGTPEWCAEFAEFFRDVHEDKAGWQKHSRQLMRDFRHDLYWDGVAEMVEKLPLPERDDQSCAAAIIAYNNEDTILRCLNSLVGNVDVIQIAHGPSTDGTAEIIAKFAAQHAEIAVNVIDVPKIEVYKFGFDDARNASVQGLDTHWILWIDTDEYLVGNFRKYLRANDLSCYLICQHHFTVEPRGSQTQIDRPARLFRNGEGYVAKGHIHEHFECPEGGPGHGYLLPDVDIGHTGYQNEAVRKQRFERNFPFLEWEMQGGSDRKLNHFLWLRDIVHRMRFAINAKDAVNAVALAREAEKYYNEHYEDMGAFGPGIFQALAYLEEVNGVLGKGMGVKVSISLEEGRTATLQSKFENYDQIERVVRQMLEPEFKARSGKYY